MNEKANILLMILVAFIIIALIPPLILYVFPPASFVMQLILSLLIYMTVRGYLGDGIITLMVSGLLIYIIVIKHLYLATSIYIFFYILMAFQFISVVIWGLNAVHVRRQQRMMQE
jgi:hypothetical protein